MKLFDKLIQEINNFTDEEPIIRESTLEQKLSKFLKEKGIMVQNQISKKEDRYDLICKQGTETVCIELKIKAKNKDIKQFDRYMPKFRDGFIIVCWQATFAIQEIAKQVKEQSPIPMEIIELSRKYAY